MKKTIITLLVVLAVSVVAEANIRFNQLKTLNALSFMSVYFEAITNGDYRLNDSLFAEDFEYRMTTNNRRFSKKQYIKHLKSTKGIQYNCVTEYNILDQNDQACVAKMTMKFDSFTRIDYVYLVLMTDRWMVDKVLTTFTS